MQLTSNGGYISMRRNTHMRSLFIEYPRTGSDADILAGLFSRDQVDLNIKLPVLCADTKGIQINFPSRLTGIFYIHIQDGDKAFIEKIAIQ